MHTLPTVFTAGGRFVFPLSDTAAAELVLAISCASASARRQHFLSALHCDPAFALWTVLSAEHAEAVTTDFVHLVDWCEQAPLAAFFKDQPSAEPDAPLPAGPAVLFLDVPLAGKCLACAELAERLAHERPVDHDAAYLLGLLHAADEWLENAAIGQSPADVCEALPAWLREALGRIGSDAEDPLIVCVAQAALQVAAADKAGPENETRARVMALGQAWAAQGDALATLAEKLARRSALETDFAAKLETAKLEALKELAYGAGHEINNPLANISARAQTLLADERDPDRRRLLAAINSQAFRAHEMIADMMLFARPPVPHKQPLDLAALLRKVLGELAEQAAEQHTEMLLSGADEPLEITADATQIAVAVKSLAVNALEALIRGGHLEITLLRPQPGEREVQIRVADDGPGIPDEARPHLFEPYYSGREAGRGLGLGLSKCWRIVTLHDGRIDVDSNDCAGAVFTITLPIGNTR
jgi:signal transduction histidine kinase